MKPPLKGIYFFNWFQMPPKRKVMSVVNAEPSASASGSSYSKKRLLDSETSARSSWPGDIEKGHSCGFSVYVLLPRVLQELGVAADIVAIIQSFILCTCAFVLNVRPSASGSLNLCMGKFAWVKDPNGEYYRGKIGENRHWEVFTPYADLSNSRNGPKNRSKSTYIAYFTETQRAYRLSHPSEIMRDLSKEWTTVEDTPLAEPYRELSRQDTARYNRELAEYQLKQDRKLIQIRLRDMNFCFLFPTPNSIYNVSSSEIIIVKS